MPYDITKVFKGHVDLYTAPSNTAMVPDSHELGATWPSPWVPSGATQEGWTLASEPEVERRYIEEQPTPAVVGVTTRSVVLSANLAQDELITLKLALGSGTITTTAPGTGQVGKDEYTFSADLNELACGFEGRNSLGFWRRMYVPRVVSVGSLEVAHRRAANYRMYNVSIESVSAMENISITDMTAVAT